MNDLRGKRKRFLIVLTAVLVLCALMLFTVPTHRAKADASSIIINELNYNPGSDNTNDEFLELYNTTASAIDLTGWCFSAGITLCLDPGTTIAAHSYGVVSPNAAQTQTTYGVSTIGTYTGALSNGGETVTLNDNNSAVINSITYDDVAPWPTTPDGTGPTLELNNPSLDNSLATSWSASQTNNGTPGAENSHVGSNRPTISDVSHPDDVTPAATPTITAKVDNATSINLVYKVMFGSDQTIPMYDDGNHYDGPAGDGVYGATIPAHAAGQLIRYKISATSSDATTLSPGSDDTINYLGYTVRNDITTQLPVLQWFMEPADLTDLVENHSQDDQEFPCVIAYGNKVIDNATVHVKGSTTRNLPEKAFAIDLPKGYKLQFAGMTRAVDEFHLNSTYLDPTSIADVLAWDLAKEMGMPTTQMFKIRLQNNGDFYGLYTFAEEYDKQWRDEFNYNNGSFYKDTHKQTRTDIYDGEELTTLYNDLDTNKSPERRTYLMDNLDVPNMINMMVFENIIRNADWLQGRNQLSYHDITDTGRWSAMPYDLDGASSGGSADLPGVNFMSPYEFGSGDGRFTRAWRSPFLAIYDEPDLRAVYYRRLRSVADEFLASGWYEQKYQELKAQTEQESALNYQKWSGLTEADNARTRIARIINDTKVNIFFRYRKPWAVPTQQSSTAQIDIDSVTNATANRQEDYVVLKNNSASAIDVSGWQIPELAYTFPLGAGLAPGQTAFLPRSDTTFKSIQSGRYVLGQLPQDIAPVGTLTIHRKDGSVASSKSY